MKKVAVPIIDDNMKEIKTFYFETPYYMVIIVSQPCMYCCHYRRKMWNKIDFTFFSLAVSRQGWTPILFSWYY